MNIGNNKNISFNKPTSGNIDKSIIEEIDKKVDSTIQEFEEIVDDLGRIEISDEEPTDENVVIWVNTAQDAVADIMLRINDETIASNTVWSSEKVNSQIQDIIAEASAHTHDNKEAIDKITTRDIDKWNNKSDFSGSYNDLTNKPMIPSINGLATEKYVDNALENALSEYVPEVEMPTKVSQLENDSGYITEIPNEYITEEELGEKGFLINEDIKDLAKKEEIPINVSELVNDSNYAKLSDLHGHNNKDTLDSITLEQVEKWNSNTSFDGNYYSLTNRPNVPARTSELHNDSGFITEEDVEGLSTTVSSDTEPTDENVVLWVNTSQDINMESIARINDSVVSNNTTWSSEKIKQQIGSGGNGGYANVISADPPTGDVEKDTQMLQALLDKANKDYCIKIEIPGEEYTVNTLYIKENTIIEMTNETVLRYSETVINDKVFPVLLTNAIPYEDTFTSYNGNGNIKISGGTIYAPSAMLFAHGENILIEEITFRNSETDHIMQIGGCKDVFIKKCKFIGRTIAGEGREYTEMIQIDWITPTGMPYWNEDSPFFDHTVNDNLIIEDCYFGKDMLDSNYGYFYVGVGSHSSDGDYKNKNIIVQRCIFENFTYAGVVLSRMENAKIRDNTFLTNAETDGIHIKNSINAIVENNIVEFCARFVYSTNSRDVRIINNNIDYLSGSNCIILARENNNLIISNNIFKNCSCTEIMIMVRGSNCVNITNNIENDCEADMNAFAHLYLGSVATSSDCGIVKNNMTALTELNLGNNVTRIINNCVGETLWSGDLTVNGALTLSDSIKKFDGLVITIQCYGTVKRNLIFTSNSWQFREVNVVDNGIISAECVLSLSDNIITFDSQNVVSVSSDKVSPVAYDIKIKNIAGFRKMI